MDALWFFIVGLMVILYAVLDGKGKLAINGTFEGLKSSAKTAAFHHGVDGQRGPKMSPLTITSAKAMNSA